MALRRSPGLIAAAVHAYCSGDPADRKVGIRLTRMLPPPTTGPSRFDTSGHNGGTSQSTAPRFVEARVTFTRQLYAQLHQAPVASAPKVFPPG